MNFDIALEELPPQPAASSTMQRRNRRVCGFMAFPRSEPAEFQSEPPARPPRRSGERQEQVAEIRGVRRVAEEGTDAEDFLQGPQGRAVRIPDGVGISAAFCSRREHEEADRMSALL